MKEGKILILNREDLRDGKIDKSYEKIQLFDFDVSFDHYCTACVVMFVDEKGTKILKNSHGMTGEVDFINYPSTPT